KSTNLNFIPSGTIPPNPSELLGSDKMSSLIEELRNSYDIIILDSAPIGLVLDYLSVVKLIDITIYVVRQGVTHKPSLSIINELSEKCKVKSTCVLLNDITSEHNIYALGSYYGDSSGSYNNGAEEKSKWYEFKKIKSTFLNLNFLLCLIINL